MPQAPAAVIDMVGTGYALDATRMAEGLGNARIANTVLLGALSTALPFAAEGWTEVLSQLVPPRTVGANLQAFQAGRDWVESGAAPGSRGAAAALRAGRRRGRGTGWTSPAPGAKAATSA